MEHSEFIKLVELAINRLEAQGRFSRKEVSNKCLYLNNGDCCVVGHMMPDDQTRISADNLEETSVWYLYDIGFPWATQFNKKQIDHLVTLQSFHDCGWILEEAIGNMRKYLDIIEQE